jgi:hypothetical protein
VFEVGLVLGVYLTVVSVIVWQLLTQPAPVGYFMCGGLGLVNVGLIITSRDWLPHDRVSLLGAAIYMASLVLQGGALFLVGGQLHRALKTHLECIRLGPEAGPQPVELSTTTKTLVLLAAGAGAPVVMELILSRRVLFLRSGEMWIFYMVVGATLIISMVAWVGSIIERRRGHY